MTTQHAFFSGSVVTTSAAALLFAVMHFATYGGSYPEHDTYYVFQAFKTVHESVLSGAGLPSWLPEIQYGSPAHIYLFPTLTPWQYLSAYVGGWIGSTATLSLFHLSVALELLFFLVGGGLLTGRLTTTRAATALFMIIAGLTTITHQQVWYNLRIVTFLPWIFYFLLRFAETGGLRWAAATTLAAMIWLIGNIFYFLPIALLVLAAGFAVNLPRRPARIRLREALEPPTLWLIIANLAFAACLLGVFRHIFDDVALHSPLRQADGVADATVFLTYGGNLDLRKFIELLLALPHNPDALFYFGAAPLALALYAPWSAAWPRARPFAWIGLLFVALSLPGLLPAAQILYDTVPGMYYFRHVGLMIAVAKVCFLLTAAVGLDGFLTDLRRPDGAGAARRLAGPAAAAFAAGLALIGIFGDGYTVYPQAQMFPDYPSAFGAPLQIAAVPLTALAVLVAALLLRRPADPGAGSSLPLLIVGLALFEGAAYAHFHYWTVASRNPAEIAAAFAARPLTFPPPRVRRTAAEDAGVVAFYGDYYPLEAMLSRPRCVEPGRRDARVPAVAELVDLRRGAALRPGEKPEPRADDAALLRAAGCERPRLRLTNQVVFLPSDAAARAFVESAPEFGRLTGVVCPAAAADCRPAAAWREVDEAVAVERFTGGELTATVTVEQPGGGWLIYADAWTPRWRVEVDGAPQPLRRADVGFKAVRVPQGAHRVTFVYTQAAALSYGYHGMMWIALACGVAPPLLRAAAVTARRPW